MGKKIFPYIIALSALAVSASAAFYSVSGLMKLFAGASLAVGIMAGSLEVSKLVIASLLYQYWDKLNKVLRTYLTIAAIVLIGITSIGIYGFLSSAYQQTADKEQIVTEQITALQTKKKLFEQSRDNLVTEKRALSDLRENLSKTTTTQYTDRKGNLVVRSNKASYTQIDKTAQVDDRLTSKLETVNDSIFNIENKILQVKTNSTASSELGPLKYVAALTGYKMDRIINWLLLVIIFVFDPLAIALVIAANYAFTRTEEKQEEPQTKEIEEIEEIVEETAPESPQESKEEKTPVQAEIETIQNSPHFSEWKKQQLISQTLKRAQNEEYGKRYM